MNNDYTTDIIPLDFGLDLVEPKPIAQSGTLSTCLNYEITDRSGLRRIDGHERFDGRVGGEASVFWVLGHSSGTVLVGDILFVDTLGTLVGGDFTSEEGCEVLGVVVAVNTANLCTIAVINDELFPIVRNEDGYVTTLAPAVDRVLFKADKSTKAVSTIGSLASVQDIRSFATSEQNHYNLILEYKQLLRSNVTELPGTVLASYTYKGIHYAVVSSLDNLTAKLYYSASERVESKRAFISGLHGGWRELDMGYAATGSSGKGVDGAVVWNRIEQGLANQAFAGVDPLYYITDGASVFTARLVSYYVTEGEISAGDAVANVQFSDLVNVSGPAVVPTSGFSVYTTATYTEANRILTLTSSFVEQTLPGLSELQIRRSRYQLMDTNYYATDSLGSVYGVSGASRPFYFNEDYFAYIYTQPVETVFARHIERTSESLALGYPDGQVLLSVAGEPWNYSGLDGAYANGFGHPIRGLLQLQGDTLAVFTSKSVRAIQGTTIDNYVPRVLAPKTGTIEYTVEQLGDAIFCSPSGVITLSQSEKYGDFSGMPISYKVNPLLRPKTSKEYRIVASTVVRNKNQYRVFSADGTVFTFTFREGKGFESTTQKYYVNRNNNSDAVGREFIPAGLSSVLDENGEEYILASHYAPYSRSTSNYMYRLEQGWGFDGQSIPASFDVNWYFAQNPFMNKVLRKVRLDGISLGRATVAVRTAKDYDNTGISSPVRASLPKRVEYIQINDTPYTSMANVEERGLNIAVKVEHLPELLATEPTHTIQTLFIQFTGAKSDA